MKRWSLVILVGWISATGWSQSVNWSPATGSFEQGVQSRLSLVFKDCDPSGAIPVPDVDGLDIGQPNSRQSHISSISGILGGKGKTTTLGFPVRATRQGQVVIPSFTVSTSEGDLRVPEARYQVVEPRVTSQTAPTLPSTSQGPTLSLDDVAQARIEFEKEEVWAGEVQEARLVFQGFNRYLQNVNTREWQPEHLTLGPWQEHVQKEGTVNGERVTQFEFPVRAQAPRLPGTYSIKPAQIGVVIQTSSGRRSAFDMFMGSRGRQVTLEAKAPELTVKPLPEAPPGFSGAIGDFIISSKMVPEEASVGEPITWTLVLEGTGNWNDAITMPNRQVPDAFEVIQPKSNTEMTDGATFVGKMTEDVVLIPTEAGTFTIPGVEFLYFDTRAGEYRTMKTEPKTLVVGEAQGPAWVPKPSVPAAGGGAVSPPVVQAQSQVVPFDGQPQLPRDPIGTALSSHRPLSLSLWVGVLMLPWFMVLGYWLLLARKRVVMLDAGFSQRQALQQLKAWDSKYSDEGVDAAALREWQRLVQRLWQVKPPLPDSDRLRQMVEQQGGDGEAWAELWSGCESVLFGQQQGLEAAWKAKFSQKLHAVRLPKVKWGGFLKPQVWLPLVLFVVWAPGLMAQDATAGELLPDANQEYQSGEYQKSEAALRLRLEEDWGDSGAHHDLALALFQQERWDEAAAHASIAALQSPGNDTIRWDVRLLTERAGWGGTLTGKFFAVSGNPLDFHNNRSVHFWQWLGISSSVLMALCVMWGLRASYQKTLRGRAVRWSLAMLALIGLLFSIYAVERWGILRHPRAVLVCEELEGRSIPSEVDQQTRPIPVGTAGFFLQDFLGWRKVMLPNREEVWVREKNVLKIYPQ